MSVFGIHVNGAQTLPENIADNGGIGLAWRSYRSLMNNPATNITQALLPGFTNDQLFWLWGAQLWCAADNPTTIGQQIKYDVHSPFEIRPQASFQNRPEFAEAFNCKASDYMGRSLTKDRCLIW